ncbi:MAG: hypothetical protein HY794_03830 [Desulfarculus sp.]|nr:hypothetical protein [Desulfarculus sp.]
MTGINLPYIPNLGNIVILEVYDYYDAPRLFSCYSKTGQIFIALWIDSTLSKEVYYFLPVSKLRFNQIRTGKIDLKSAFSEPEDGYLCEVSFASDFDKSESVFLKSTDVVQDNLPEGGELLSEQELPVVDLPEAQISARAQQTNREAVYLELDPSSKNKTEIPANYLGGFLTLLQMVIDSVGRVKARAIKKRKFKIKEYLEGLRLEVWGVRAGSFGVLLSSPQFTGLFGESELGSILKTLFALIEAGADEKRLRLYFQELKSTSARRYGALLKHIVNTNTGLMIQWASPDPNVNGMAIMPVKIAVATSLVVNKFESEIPDEYAMVGQLTGITLRRKTFEIIDVDNDERYSGKILDEAMSDATTATMSATYNVIIREVLEIVQATGEEKIKYQLKSLKPLSLDNN